MSRRKKILIVGPELSLQGGVAHHVRTLLSSRLKKDYQLDYFRIGPIQDDRQFRVILKFLVTPFRFLWKLWKFLPDVVHFNPSFDPKSIIRELNMLALCKLHNRATLVQFHGGNLCNLMQNGRIPFYIKLILKWASHIVVLTNIQQQPLLKYCSSNHISVIPNMIDTGIYYSKSRKFNSQYRILYMSKLEYKKGAFDVIEAVQYVISKFSNVTFLFAGDGPDKDKLQLLCCEHGLEDNVKLLGYVRDQKKVMFLSRGDLFLFPSHYNEGMPYALIEAMAAGLPVIATSRGGMPEIIEHRVNGFLVQPQQPKQLAQAINKLLSNKKARREFGKLNRYKAVTEYDINVVCQKFSGLYEKLSELRLHKKRS